MAVGDIALCGDLGRRLERGEVVALPDETRSLLAGCDLRIGNLETVLTNHPRRTGSIGSFISAPVSAVSVLVEAGFDVLSVANNHARDCRLSGLLQCIDVLQEHGIRSCGAGASNLQARSPAIVEAAGVRIGVLGYCDNFRVDADANENVAPAEATDDWIASDISSLRRRVDLVILQLHWGWEFSVYPLLSYRDRARRFAEAGADVVMCHHAHVPMGLEVWGNSIIAHGLGNFVLPPDEYLAGGHPWTYRTIALRVFFDRAGAIRAEIIPCTIDENGFPRLAEGQVAAEILGGVGRASRRLRDDTLLARLERDRTIRETVSFFSALQACSADEAGEWALQLHSPFLKDVVSKLEPDHGSAGEMLAAFMRQFAASYQDAQLVRSMWKKSHGDDLVSALDCLRSSGLSGAGLPGRVP
jgi:poly-gamma-glutamate capsule biosynthesis protein CapA/YwtB (metallophosphatase superfamily)